MLPAMFDKHHCTHIFLYSTWFAVTNRMKISPTIVTIFVNHHALCMSVWDGCLESSDVTESKMGSRLQTRLTSLSHLLSCLCTSLFGHVVLLDDNTPSDKAVQLHVSTSLSRPSDMAVPTWSSTEQVTQPSPRQFHPSHNH